MASKNYTLQNLGCPNCAAKMENRIAKLPGVKEASVSYPNKLLRVTADAPDDMLPEIQKICAAIESGVKVLPRQAANRIVHASFGKEAEPPKGNAHHDHDPGIACACDEEHHSHAHNPNSQEWKSLLTGGILFALAAALHVWRDALLPEWGWIVVFAVPYLILSLDVLKEAGGNLRQGDLFDENFLMLIASIGAFVTGQYVEGVAVMLFYRVGEYFEHRAVEKSRASIMETVDMRPENVTRIQPDGSDQTIPAEAAKVGDILRILPGERIPLDGTVQSGASRIDTSPVTGEPVPVSAQSGTALVSGSMNLSGMLEMRVDKELSDSMVTRILDAVENASANKPKIEKFITRFARIYTPIVCIAAVLLAVVPPLLSLGAWNDWVYRALNFLVVSCPCALVLSVPLAFFAGIGKGSRKGILFKGGHALEALNETKLVVFDKTGTLTKGEFAVQQIAPAGQLSAEELLQLAAEAERFSTHPIAESIRCAATERRLTLGSGGDVEEIAGHGLRMAHPKGELLCGNAALMNMHQIALPSTETEERTKVYLALDGQYIGSIAVEDALKPEAAAAVQALKARGLHTAMLTGDNQATADRIAGQLGLHSVYAKLLPDEKLQALQSLRQQHGAAMFVGDGINDAPVLAGADVGAAMGTGADAAIEAADVVFMTSQVEAVPESMILADQTHRIAVQNVVFALGVKALVLVLSVLGLSNLWMAVFADVGVALLCVLNAMRLSWGGGKQPTGKQISPSRS